MTNGPRMVTVVMVLASVAGLGGCRSCPDTDRPSHVPDDFRVTLAKGGGFTGLWQGQTLLGTGAVWRWSGFGAASDSTLVGVLPRAVVDSVWADVLATGLLDREVRGSGNLSARISISGAGRSAELSWASGLSLDTPQTPEEDFYGRTLTRIARHADVSQNR